MSKSISNFLLKLAGFTVLLCAVHYYIFISFFSEIALYFPLWSIYLFNTILVLAVYLIIYYKVAKGDTKTYQIFLILTLVKMVLAIIFLLPLFVGKSTNAKVEVINFFLPYFFYLVFEIFMLNKFFNMLETK